MVMMAIESMDNDNDKAFMLSLYHDYYGLVWKTVYNITRDAGHAEDLVNDTFIRLIEKISVIRKLDSCKLAAYVVYTSRSVAINFIKHRDVQSKYAYYGKELDLQEEIPSLEESIEEKIIYQEKIEVLVNAILKLPEKYKNLLYFKYVLEMDDREIAGILRIAPNSVRQYLTRARRKAKELMDKEMDTRAQ
ncbi:MAG TPA: sigma-70 family RNA polymerase sigma factor [Syntrophomonadaceae bacterium]|nr:sigma-70 family RNA polymerase sigma factor [Syntrophomonadaceae bacterium]